MLVQHMNYYNIYGFKLKSELEFSGLQSCDSTTTPDILLTENGEIPLIDNSFTKIGVTSYARSQELILEINNLVKFYVINAKCFPQRST